ncbi:efflux RND transporter permease subunit [Paraburkholderia sp. CNPSo 3076]|uniref:efflux RND transporter permease subunit n=1 Tax=Paraburkholderia sp. CNPSo 3076 TaxID=2940936 RepID=UPI003A52371E
MVVAIHKAPGANVTAAVDAVVALLPSLESRLPKTISVEVESDRAQTIRASVADVQLSVPRSSPQSSASYGSCPVRRSSVYRLFSCRTRSSRLEGASRPGSFGIPAPQLPVSG